MSTCDFCQRSLPPPEEVAGHVRTKHLVVQSYGVRMICLECAKRVVLALVECYWPEHA